MKKRIIAIAIVAILALAIGVNYYKDVPVRRLAHQLDLGQKYLEEQEYEQAVIAFVMAITIGPMNADAYIGLADAYIGLGDYENVLEVLQQGYEQTRDERLKAKIDEMGIEQSGADESSNMAGQSGEGGELAGSDEEDIVYTEFIQKLEHLATLFETGCSDNMFQFGEWTFFGHNLSSHDMNNWGKEVFLSILAENGYVQTGTDDNKKAPYYFSAGWSHNGRFEPAPGISERDLGQNGPFDVLTISSDIEMEKQIPIGVRDIYTCDPLVKVLTNLGFTNGKEISDYINESFTIKDYSLEGFDLQWTVVDVGLLDSNPRLSFSFTNKSYDYEEIRFYYENELLTVSESSANIDFDVFDSFILDFFCPDSDVFLSFQFNQCEGSFMYLNAYEIIFLYT